MSDDPRRPGCASSPSAAGRSTSPGRFSLEVTWWEGLPREVREQGYSVVLADRIAELLGDEPMTAAEIVAGLNAEDDAAAVKVDSVTKALRRGIVYSPARFTVAGTGRRLGGTRITIERLFTGCAARSKAVRRSWPTLLKMAGQR